jgi:hypothetical protein
MRVLADAAEEVGEHELATGFRWLADKARWPSAETAYFCRQRRKGQPQRITTSTGWKTAYVTFNHPSGWERDSGPTLCNYLPQPVVRRVTELKKLHAPDGNVETVVWLALAAQALGEWLAAANKGKAKGKATKGGRK